MTDTTRGNWSRYKAVYVKQDVADTPVETRPNEMVGAVDHFSKKTTLRKYNNPDGYIHSDGIPTSGEYTEVDFWCILKPPTRGAINKEGLNINQDMDGEFESGQWLVIYNPFHEKHGEVHLEMSSEKGFADVIEYQGDLWKVTNLVRLESGYGEDVTTYIGKAKVSLWSNPVASQSGITADQKITHYRIS